MKTPRVSPKIRIEIPFWDWCSTYRELVRQRAERRGEMKKEYGGSVPVENELNKHIFRCKDCLELLLKAQRSLRLAVEDGTGLQISIVEQIEDDLVERGWGPEEEQVEMIGQVVSGAAYLVFTREGKPQTLRRVE